jgi:hypothetical protein
MKNHSFTTSSCATILQIPKLGELAGEGTSYLTVTVSNQRYVIKSPDSRPFIPVGRWTRSSFAYDIENKHRVFVKDSWRILADDIEPEGNIYERLEKGDVPNVPRCLSSGDIGDDTRRNWMWRTKHLQLPEISSERSEGHSR